MNPAFCLDFIPLAMGRVSTLPIGLLERLAAGSLGPVFEELVALEAKCAVQRGSLSESFFKLLPQVSDSRVRGAVLALKRHVAASWAPFPKKDLEAARAVLSPETAGEAEAFNGLVKRRQDLLSGAKASFELRLVETRAALAGLLSDPFIKEGLFLSSSKLFEGMQRYAAAPPRAGQVSKNQRRLERSVMDHLSRVCAKTTPRANLTAVDLGELDPALPFDASIGRRPGTAGIGVRRSVLSLSICRELARRLSSAPEAWRYVVPRPNPTIRRRTGEHGEIAEYTRMEGREEALIRVPLTPAAALFLELAGGRRLNAASIVESAHGELEGHRLEDLQAYYLKLVDAGLIIGHLEIPYNRFDGLAYLIGWAETVPAGILAPETLEALRKLRALIARLDEPPY